MYVDGGKDKKSFFSLECRLSFIQLIFNRDIEIFNVFSKSKYINIYWKIS